MDLFSVNGASMFRSTTTIIVSTNQPAELWVSTSAVTPHLYVSTSGYVGIGTAAPGTRLDVQAAAADPLVQTWRNSSSVVQASMTAAGTLYAKTVTNLSAPIANSDAANKAYVDAASGPRYFYLTTASGPGDSPLTACAAGYHFASQYELWSLSSLRYNTSLGYTQVDSGSGPPTAVYGWVRTGYVSYNSNLPGAANCAVWTNNAPGLYGSAANLLQSQSAGVEIVYWTVQSQPCNSSNMVWCILD